MPESEAKTRKTRIDEKLKSPLLNWTIIHNNNVSDYSALTAHAVEEFPTETGPADYALFVQGKLLFCYPIRNPKSPYSGRLVSHDSSRYGERETR